MSKSKGPSQRQLKAGELIRRALADIILREELRDPALRGRSITISEVRASPDLKHAIVFAAPLLNPGEPSDMEEVIEGLNRSAKFLRGHLGKELEMRSTPALKFEADKSFAQASEMQDLLDSPNVKQDLE